MRPTRQSAYLLGNWRYLLILDAARPDYVQARWPDTRCVEALGGITHVWCENLWRLIDEPMTYITANPAATRKHRQVKAPHVCMVDAWRDLWKDHGTEGQRLETVHSADLVKWVVDWLDNHRMPHKLVVHFPQPHAPYIVKPLPVQAGNIQAELVGKKSGDVAILEAVRKGQITWEDVRQSYGANCDLAMVEAARLSEVLQEHTPGRTIITSDHGEALGEGGYFGHAGIPYGYIRQVPLRRI